MTRLHQPHPSLLATLYPSLYPGPQWNLPPPPTRGAYTESTTPGGRYAEKKPPNTCWVETKGAEPSGERR